MEAVFWCFSGCCHVHHLTAFLSRVPPIHPPPPPSFPNCCPCQEEMALCRDTTASSLPPRTASIDCRGLLMSQHTSSRLTCAALSWQREHPHDQRSICRRPLVTEDSFVWQMIWGQSLCDYLHMSMFADEYATTPSISSSWTFKRRLPYRAASQNSYDPAQISRLLHSSI